jgi:hypothetical protein
VPLQVEKQSSGTYRLTWTVPIGAHSYRLKYSDKNIVEWLDFDAVTNRFLKDPAANAPWFAASDASGVPAPAAAKSTQSYEVGALDSKTQWHFALKAYVENGP